MGKGMTRGLPGKDGLAGKKENILMSGEIILHR